MMTNDKGMDYLEEHNWTHRYSDFAKVGAGRAREIGQRVYWSGSKCKNGHIFWRYTANGECCWCRRSNNIRVRGRRYESGSRMLDIDALREASRLQRELKEMEL